MTELSDILERLGLVQYLERFVEEGFETWETLIYATESDLQALEVKLGHRRKLQKEIADARGVGVEQIIGTLRQTSSVDDTGRGDIDARANTGHGDFQGSTVAGPMKRKYRRHPKPDENAPERAPSAYVIFSNKTREELKPQKLSFTDIAKAVGERWQSLDPEEKEQYESQAATAKEQYNAELTKYKRTTQYREHQKYLADFKARNTPQPTAGTKRPKLETEHSGASSHSTSSTTHINSETMSARRDSLSSQPAYSPLVGSATSPTNISRLTTRSRESSINASMPNTPFNVAFPPTIPIPAIGNQRSYEIQPPQLPRILPLDTRDPRPIAAALIADPTLIANPRRSTTGSPAIFLRQDTSKSSTSSNFSRDSTASSIYTPISPIEDNKAGRSLPPILSLSHHGSMDSAYSNDSDRRAPQMVTARVGPEVGDRVPQSSLGYPPFFRHLSLHGDPHDMSRHQEGTQHQDLPTHSRRQPIPAARDHQNSSMSVDQAATSRMDPLSVLALAGRMVDQEPSRRGETSNESLGSDHSVTER